MSGWTFVTSHGSVLACIARSERITAREIAHKVGITERSVLRIIADLEAEGYLVRRRDGRVNQYEINLHLPLRLRGAERSPVQHLVTVLLADPAGAKEPVALAQAAQG